MDAPAPAKGITAAPTATTTAATPFARTVLIALDGSPCSDHAFQWALNNFIRKDGKDLVVLAAVRLPQTIPGSYGSVLGNWCA